jgi:hypothetical protein
VLVVLWAASVVCLAANEASELAKKARKAEKAGKITEAYLLYSQAAAADPKKPRYWTKSQALRTRALRESKTLPLIAPAAADSTAQKAEESAAEKDQEKDEDLPGIGALLLPEEEEEARRPLPPKELASPSGTKSFDLRGDARQLFEKVAKEFGLDLVFDADYQAGSPFRFQLNDVDFRTALSALQAATSSFVVPLSERVFMVYKDTQQKRAEAEPTVAVTLSLPNPVTLQEAQELARAVQQTMEIQRFAIDGGRRLVLIKDKVSKVRAAQEIYQHLLTHRSQVILEIELMDLQGRRELSYGMTLPTSTALSILGRRSGNASRLGGFRFIPEFAQGFSKFVLMGGGFSTIALAVSDASAFASFNRSQSYSLYRATMRSVDGQPATLHIGDKYPIITQQFIGAPSDTPVLAVPPTFNFEDLGISLKVTPRVHDSAEVSLQVEAEFKVLGTGSFNGIPVIANRKFASTVRLRQGEWAVISGLLNATEARSVSGIAGLGRVPLLSNVVNSTSKSVNSGEALLVIKPRIIDSASTEFPVQTIYTGTEGRWNTLP